MNIKRIPRENALTRMRLQELFSYDIIYSYDEEGLTFWKNRMGLTGTPSNIVSRLLDGSIPWKLFTPEELVRLKNA